MLRIRIRPISGWIPVALFLTLFPATLCGAQETAPPANDLHPAPQPGKVSTAQTADRHGIDVSHHQNDIDWTKVKAAGHSFVFIKATEGVDYTDPNFGSYWIGSKEAGLVRGAYHFFHPDDDAKTQAEFFIATVTLQPGDLPPALDVEVAEGVSPAALIDDVKTWLDLVEAAYGVKPIIYSDLHFLQAEVTQNQLKDYPLWLADYTENTPEAPGAWTDWTLWQFSRSGIVDGIDGEVDRTLFRGILEDWEALLIPQK